MKPKRCEILCVGTELLLGDILNTNAQYLAQGLSQLGLDLYVQTVVGDNPTRMEEAIRAAMNRAQILLFTGGLGPTSDDLTREVVARCFERPLVLNEEALQEIQAFYALTRRPMPKSNIKQAMLPEGGKVLYNPQGTAPGSILESPDGHIAILLPGPPREMQAMFESQVVPYLSQFSTGVLVSRLVRVVSLGESRMAEMLADLIDAGQNPTLAPYAKDSEAMVRVTAKAKTREEALKLTEPAVEEIKKRLRPHVYGVDVPNIETAVAELVLKQGLRISFLEVNTAGLAASRFSQVQGVQDIMGASLSAPGLDALTNALCLPDIEEKDPALACQALAQAAQTKLNSPLVLSLMLLPDHYACAAQIDGETRQVTLRYPEARGLLYGANAAVLAAFDLLRLALGEQTDPS